MVEDHADLVLGIFHTQHDAIVAARNAGHHPLVDRVSYLNNKRGPDHGRALRHSESFHRGQRVSCGVYDRNGDGFFATGPSALGHNQAFWRLCSLGPQQPCEQVRNDPQAAAMVSHKATSESFAIVVL